MRLILAAAAALSFGAAAFAEDEPTGPSFDCEKAATAGEKAVCDAPGLGWYDRQLAKSFGLAKTAAGKAGEAALKDGQQAFLKKRDACTGDDNYDCIVKAYDKRLAELAAVAKTPDFAFGDFAGESGGVTIMRYPDRLAAVTISTVGGGDATCSFETDKAKQGAGGAISYEAKYEGMDGTCKIEIAEANGSIHVSTTAHCSYWCGARASLDGEFKKAAP